RWRRAGEVHRKHREAEERRFRELLLVKATEIRPDYREVVALALDERLTDGDAPRRARAQLLGDVEVQPLAVLQDVARVAGRGARAELIPGAGDESADLAPSRGLSPVERLRHDRHTVGIDEVIAEVAALAE